MNILLEAARIAEARFAALGPTIMGFDPITGSLTWKNNQLTAGASALVGYILGKYDAATGTFSVWTFIEGGVTYAWGSVLTSAAPAVGSSKTDPIKSYALNFATTTSCDALCSIASGTLRSISADYGVGARIIGLNWADWQALSFVDRKPFIDALTVTPWVAAGEVTGFIVTKA